MRAVRFIEVQLCVLKQAVGCEPPVSALASGELEVLSSKGGQELKVNGDHLDLKRDFVLM